MTIVIAVDGLSAAGKGLLSKSLAAELGFDYLDTGALYRTLAYHARAKSITENDIKQIVDLAPKLDFTNTAGLDLYSEEISRMASKIAAQPDVRNILDTVQRKFPEGKYGAVIDGRDIGTVIFPNAECKFFITANLESRAERRYKQLQNAGEDITLPEILQSLKERDERDIARAISPAVPAEDAIIVDTSYMEPKEVLELVLSKTREALKGKIMGSIRA